MEEDEKMMINKTESAGDALMKLQERVAMAYDKLEYAEEKMIVPYGTTNTLFDDLRGVSNDLKDTIDESLKHIDIMATLFSKVHWYSPFIYIYHNLCFPWQINHRIRTIESRLEEILKHELNFGLTLFNLDTPIEDDTLVGGIEKDAETLVEMLVTENGPIIQIYSIVGERGIGKTTLAKKIFNHKKISDKFHSPPPIWIHVHRNDTHVTIVKSIIDKIGGDSCNANSIEKLESILRDLIGKKNFFIVLDDVRDLNNFPDFDDYMYMTYYIVENLKILVTSRYESVMTRRTRDFHKHKPLSEEDGWALMSKLLLFKDDEKGNMQGFEEIGKKMVNKCHGLPLSIKAIARILNAKEKNPSEWEKVLDNIIVLLEPIKTLPKPVYLICYENLSPYIKQCFIFCAFFPEDYIFQKNILIQQWIVAGLVKEPSTSIQERGKNIIIEDVATDYYMELLESNILQPAECLYYDDEAMCRVHGNLRSFGQHLIKNGYFQGDVKKLEEASSSSSSSSVSKLHHLVITNDAPFDVFPNIVKKLTSVRTLIFTTKLEITRLPKKLFQKLKLLRILDISGSDCMVLLRSLFKLVHLRHLNLSYLPIKALPEAIGNLNNLQYLILRYCTSLLNLPDSITRLQKLRSIDLHQTPLMGMPIGIRRLTQLTSLIGFVSSDSASYSSLDEIKFLRELRTINIVNLEVANVPSAEIFKDHIYLTDLTISCREEGQPYEEVEKEKMQMTFGNLSPPNTIQHIKINGYFGPNFPNWIEDFVWCRSSHLRRLDLLKCKYCKKLPRLGQFPLLEHVRIEDAWSIEHIDSEFLRWGGHFPQLRSLILQDMLEWTEWTWEPREYDYTVTCLESLELINCPKLKSLPPELAHHATSLTTLTIYKAHSLEKIEGFKSVQTATFFSNHNLSKVSGFSPTCKFDIDDCPKLDVTLLSQTSLQTP